MLNRVSVVIPTFNEADSLPKVIDGLDSVSGSIAKEVEIVIVDDDSPDGTGRIAELLASRMPNIRVLHRPRKKGVSSAFFDGASVAGSDYIVMMDADLHHRPEFVPNITRHLIEYDIVIASRFVEGSGMRAASVVRSLLTRLGNCLARCVLRCGVRDCTHGFRGYRREAFFQCYNPENSGGEFNLRILVEAKRNSLKIIEIPYNSNHMGKAKLRNWINYFWFLIKAPLSSRRSTAWRHVEHGAFSQAHHLETVDV